VLRGQDVLRETARLVEIGWCKGADARDGAGLAVRPHDRAAVAWSLLGALALVSDMPDVGLAALTDALGGIASVIRDPSLSAWNDRPDRTQAQMLLMLEHARRSIDDPEAAIIWIH
jgi:hypothetical protein